MNTQPVYFSSPAKFRAWLTEHHATEQELVVGFYKVATGKPSLTWEQSVDEALCFGWIDSVRKRVDEEAYTIRFTPRRPNSIWSKKNLASMQRLINDGLMEPAGLSVYQARLAERSGVYAFEQEEAAQLNTSLRQHFHAQPAAWDFFQNQPPGYRKTISHWIMSAKQEATQLRRINRVIEVSAQEKRIDLLSPFKKTA